MYSALMSLPITQKTTDHSDLEKFAFSFFCDNCGKEWQSHALPFKKGGFTAIENDDGLKLLWANEHRLAFEQANLDAVAFFNRCANCGKRVCDDCFNVEGGYLCCKCNEQIEEFGIKSAQH